MEEDSFDGNTLGKRVGRYTKVSKTVGGLAIKLAGQKYLGLDINKPEHAKKLMENLGNLKGPLLKIAQLLATIPEALPREYAAELQQLQSDAPPMGWPFVKRRMKAELGADWQSKFKSFEKHACAAASLGQVHKGVTHDGIDIACKLQYPDMKSAVEADLNQLKIFFGVMEKYDKAVITKDIYQEIHARLYEELDYKSEAKFCKLYNKMLKDEKQVHVPKIIEELSTDRLLSATWLEGRKVLSYIDAPQEQRNEISRNLFRAWYIPLYHYGIIHGDPHFGNYSVREDNGLNLLDFGCVRVFQPQFIEGVINLYHALMKEDDDLAMHAYESWGFKNISKELLEVLNTWAKFLYGPIMEDKIRTIGEVKGEVYGKDIAQGVHKELRKLGGIKPPSEFVFMDRAALGLGSVFLHLKAENNWHQMFNELIEDFDAQRLADRQTLLLK